jgi:hypothetical protein
MKNDGKMKNQNVVDGFSDARAPGNGTGVNAPDPGWNPKAAKPLSPEQYQTAQQRARAPNESNRKR